VDRSRRGFRTVAVDQMTLAEHWRSARPKVAGLHLDSAACSRQSFAVIDATSQHARHEAEVGGYVAAEAAAPALDAGRAAIGQLTGMGRDDVVFTTGSNNALDVLLGSWPGERTITCLPGEYGPNLAIMAANDFAVSALPVDGEGRLAIDEATRSLAANPPALVHFTPLASHRGLAQPLGALAEVCRDMGLPLVVDAAQALGHLDCAVGAAAIYTSSRKWLAGPRGVGALAIRRELAERLEPRLPPAEWGLPLTVMQRLDHGEANVATRVGFSVALGEHLAAGPAQVRARLAQVGRMTRVALADLRGWRVVEPLDEPTAITTLEPVNGADPQKVRAWLIAERGIVTTYGEVLRAPFEMSKPVLRASPHVDSTAEDLEQFAEALTAATAQM
jgi:hercynylcysteine S-oxide lyase